MGHVILLQPPLSMLTPAQAALAPAWTSPFVCIWLETWKMVAAKGLTPSISVS